MHKFTLFVTLAFALVSASAFATERKTTLEELISAQEMVLNPVSKDSKPLIGYQGHTELAAKAACDLTNKNPVYYEESFVVIERHQIYFEANGVAIVEKVNNKDAFSATKIDKIVCK